MREREDELDVDAQVKILQPQGAEMKTPPCVTVGAAAAAVAAAFENCHGSNVPISNICVFGKFNALKNKKRIQCLPWNFIDITVGKSRSFKSVTGH